MPSEKLDLRLTPRAAAAHRSGTSFMLGQFQLDQEQWDAFVAALDAPPQAHARLAQLLQEPSVFEQAPAANAE